MDTLSIVCQFLLSLSILIVLHEMGHFAPAKWFKTRVEKFYLFFDAPPFNSLMSRKIGETEYGIGWLPLGGYVKISGMVDESMDKEQMKGPAQPWEFRSKPAWQRLIIMIGGVTVNFLLGFFLFAMVLWGWGRNYIPTSELQENGMAFDSLLLNNGFQQGDLILKVGDKPFDRLDPNDFRKTVMLHGARQATVQRGGQTQVVTFSNDFAKKLPKIKKSDLLLARVPFVVDTALAGKPAAIAGIQKGDRIVSVNGQSMTFFEEFKPLADQFKNQTIPLGIISAKGDTLSKTVTISEHGTIGVGPKYDEFFKKETQNYTLAQAFPAGVEMGWGFLTDQMQAFGMMFKGDLSVKDNLGSVISIGKLFDPAWDWRIFWTVTASLSIILAFMNLLPIPALDGGYVLFLIWEVVTGRKVSDTFMERAVTVGFFLLIGLMIVALGLDIWRLFRMNHFEFYQLPVALSVDELAVRRAYLLNSKKYHPDFHTLSDEAEQAKMLELSTRNNNAFKTLSDPDNRVRYVLEMKGLLGKNNENASLPQDFLMEMMDINEALMELSSDFDTERYANTLQAVNNLERELETSIQPIVSSWTEITGSDADLQKVQEYFFKKRYLLRIKENLSKFAPA